MAWDLERAEAILASHPEVASCDIHAAAILGDDAAVRRFLALDSGNATATSEPHGGNALVYLGLSKYLRLDKSRSDAFLRAAQRCSMREPVRIPGSGLPASIRSSRPLSTAPPASRTTRR